MNVFTFFQRLCRKGTQKQTQKKRVKQKRQNKTRTGFLFRLLVFNGNFSIPLSSGQTMASSFVGRVASGRRRPKNILRRSLRTKPTRSSQGISLLFYSCFRPNRRCRQSDPVQVEKHWVVSKNLGFFPWFRDWSHSVLVSELDLRLQIAWDAFLQLPRLQNRKTN